MSTAGRAGVGTPTSIGAGSIAPKMPAAVFLAAIEKTRSLGAITSTLVSPSQGRAIRRIILEGPEAGTTQVDVPSSRNVGGAASLS